MKQVENEFLFFSSQLIRRSFLQFLITENPSDGHAHTVNGVMQNVGSAVHDVMKQVEKEFLFFSSQLIQRSLFQFLSQLIQFLFTENASDDVMDTTNGMMQNVGSTVHDVMKQLENEFLFFSCQLIQRSFLQFLTTEN